MMAARFPGKCPKCQQAFPAGTPIEEKSVRGPMFSVTRWFPVGHGWKECEPKSSTLARTTTANERPFMS